MVTYAWMCGRHLALMLGIAGMLLGLAKGVQTQLSPLEQLLTDMDGITQQYSSALVAADAVDFGHTQGGKNTGGHQRLVAEACSLAERIEECLWRRHLITANLEEQNLADAEAAVAAFLDLSQRALARTGALEYMLLNESLYYLHQFPTRIASLRGQRNPTDLSPEYAKTLLEGRTAASKLMRLLEQIGFSTAGLWCPIYGQKLELEEYKREEILERQVQLTAQLSECFRNYVGCVNIVVDGYYYDEVEGDAALLIAQDIVLQPWEHFKYLIGHPSVESFLYGQGETDHCRALLKRLKLATQIGSAEFAEARRLAEVLFDKAPPSGQYDASCCAEPRRWMFHYFFWRCNEPVSDPFTVPIGAPEAILDFDHHLSSPGANWGPNLCNSYSNLRTGFLKFRDQHYPQVELAFNSRNPFAFVKEEMTRYEELLGEIKNQVQREKQRKWGVKETGAIALKKARLDCAAASFLPIAVLNDLGERGRPRPDRSADCEDLMGFCNLFSCLVLVPLSCIAFGPTCGCCGLCCCLEQQLCPRSAQTTEARQRLLQQEPQE